MGGVILLISIALNLILNTVCKIEFYPVRIESILATRYVFMAVVAYWFLRDPDNKWFLFILPIISVIYWCCLSDYDFRPLISNSAWRSQQFPSFFYTFLLVWFLRYITPRTPRKLREAICWFGVNSWYIYLSQMLFFWVLPLSVFNDIAFHSSETVIRVTYVFVALFGSTLPVALYRWYEKTRVTINARNPRRS